MALAVLCVLVLLVVRSFESAQLQMPDAIVLASMTQPGCEAPGQLWLALTNVSDRPLLKATGTLSYGSADIDPVPMGNFEIAGPLLPGLSRGTCIEVDESRRPGSDRSKGWWLAWVTQTELAERTGNPSNPVDQGFLQGASR